MPKIPPPIIAVTTALAMWLAARHIPLYTFDHLWPSYAGYFLIATGLLLDICAVLQFRSAKTTINPLRPANSTAVVTTGLYRFSRNPMYLGLLIVLCGLAMLLKALSPILLLPVFVVLINTLQIIPEERVLQNRFGEPYSNYLRSVRRWL